MHIRPILWLICTLILMGCGGTGRVMETGVLQKRKHLGGWDLVLRKKKETVPSRVDAGGPHGAGAPAEMVPATHGVPELEAYLPAPPFEMAAPEGPIQFSQGGGTATYRPDPIPIPPPVMIPGTQEDLMPKKRWNRLAIPAFLAALGTIFLGLFSVSTIAVIAGIVITFVLSGISIRQIRRRDEAGKGFALIALILALLAAVATAMATYVVGFV